MKKYQVETQERHIVEIVSDNIKRYMKLNDVKKSHLENECGSATVQNMLNKKTVRGCSIVSLQRMARALGVKTIDLVEDWED